TVRQLAELVHGQVCGDGDLVVTAARPVSEAEPGTITFIETDRHAHHLPTCRPSAAVAPAALEGHGLTLIRVHDPLAAFIAIVRHLHGRAEPAPHGIDPHAHVHATARIGPDTSIFPLAVIGEGTVVGARCRLYSGVVIG